MGKRNMKWLLSVVLGFAGILAHADAYGANSCVKLGGHIYTYLPAKLKVNIPDGPPAPGAPLGEWSTLYTAEPYLCQALSTGAPRYVLRAVADKAPVPGITFADDGTTYPVYQTQMPGVGVAVGFLHPETSAFVPLKQGTVAMYGNQAASTMIGITWKVRLIATAPLTVGQHTTQTQGYFASLEMDNAGKPATLYVIFSDSVMDVVANSCHPVLPTMDVRLDAQNSAAFAGPRSIAKAADFQIGLNCSGSAGPFDLYATLTDAQNPANLGTDITLAPGSAQGVGLQLWKDGAALRMGPDNASIHNPSRWYAGTIDGMANIPLQAYYVQTGDTVEPGPVNAAVTFNLSYQ